MNNITNMTREEINKFSGVEPYCFETDREEDWYKMGCIDGLEWLLYLQFLQAKQSSVISH